MGKKSPKGEKKCGTLLSITGVSTSQGTAGQHCEERRVTSYDKRTAHILQEHPDNYVTKQNQNMN